MNPTDVGKSQINTKQDWFEFYCLASCSQIITSKVSSFSDEARRVRDVKITKI